MNTIQLFGSTLGLGFAAGIRLYATVLALGLAIRFNWYHLAPGQEHLRVLAEPLVLSIAGLACIIEFLSDKIPWVDSLWDSFHTIIRPVGGAILGATFLGSTDHPALKVVLVILCGGVAFTSHSSKAATRLAVNHSPEPFSNIGLSLLEDGLAPLCVWLATKHPVAAAVLVLMFLAAFAWLSPKVFRLVRLELVALRMWITRLAHFHVRGAIESMPFSAAGVKAGVVHALKIVVDHASALPHKHARAIASWKNIGQSVPFGGVRCAATKEIKGLRNSIGYLTVVGDELLFVTRRLYRFRFHAIHLDDIVHAEWKRGLLLNRLVLETPTGKEVFYVFKDVNISGFRSGAVVDGSGTPASSAD
jgi:Domain of unknown function (DUF4126)